MTAVGYRLVAAILITLFAIGLRLTKLGEWSFSADEVATIRECDALLDRVPLSDDPTTRLPRLTPVGPFVHGLSYRNFGRTEFAARLPAAIAGSLLCGLVVLGLWPNLGGWVAIASALLIAVNPEAIFYSQYNRYYAIGSLFAGGTILAALHVRRLGIAVLAALLAAVAVFDHLLLVGLFPGLIAATIVLPIPQREKIRALSIITIFGAIVAAILLLYTLPIAKGWNSGVDWGYSIPRAIAGAINQLSVPTALLMGLGTVLLLAERNPYRWFWAIWVAGWAASVIVFPKIMAFHPGYTFLYLFGPLVVAGFAVGTIARRIEVSFSSRWSAKASAVAWIVAATFLGAPSLISHYSDGSRHDFRVAARYVKEHRLEGEGVAAISPGNLVYYSADLGDSIGLNPEHLKDGFALIEANQKRCWVVLLGGRGERDREIQKWLSERCRLQTRFRRPRFDYYDFSIEIYLFEPNK